MSIKYYYPDNHPTIFLESREDLEEALDIMHTQAIDNLGEDDDVTLVLSRWIEELDLLSPDTDWRPLLDKIKKEDNRLRIYVVWLWTCLMGMTLIALGLCGWILLR